MKERNWQALAQELRELIGETTEAARVEIIAQENDIKILPVDRTTFHHTEQVVDFCRCKKLSNYSSWCNIDKTLYVQIF